MNIGSIGTKALEEECQDGISRKVLIRVGNRIFTCREINKTHEDVPVDGSHYMALVPTEEVSAAEAAKIIASFEKNN